MTAIYYLHLLLPIILFLVPAKDLFNILPYFAEKDSHNKLVKALANAAFWVFCTYTRSACVKTQFLTLTKLSSSLFYSAKLQFVQK